jgi:hypothetical protein
MSNGRSSSHREDSTSTTLMPMSVDVDIVRFEKNLLQIGFFGANDARDKNRASRRVEQLVSRNGHKVKVAAEFRGSEQLGLPSTTDRDKFIALLKIVSEDRARTGQISNPIRFSGYRLIQELGISRNGEVYEEIVRWGKRMTDTTITSEQVVYFAAKKVYSDEVLHVFRSFKRTGSSKLDGTERQEHYEVVLEDWLVENLNQRYVIPEDFNAYKQLTRPTAKGIFGNLHLWFHASQGRPVEKDYSELCNLLNVQAYPHLSKIKSTMGLALDELIKIKYLAKWEVERMISKDGYKVILTPGRDILRLLENSRSERRQPQEKTVEEPTLSRNDEVAVECLLRHGVLAVRAKQLVTAYGPARVTEIVEYIESQLLSGGRRTIDNPAGFIIHSLENDLPIPAAFTAARRQGEMKEAEVAYSKWLEAKKQEALKSRFSEKELQAAIQEMVDQRSRVEGAFNRMSDANKVALAKLRLQKEIEDTLSLPTFEEWLSQNTQTSLFRA